MPLINHAGQRTLFDHTERHKSHVVGNNNCNSQSVSSVLDFKQLLAGAVIGSHRGHCCQSRCLTQCLFETLVADVVKQTENQDRVVQNELQMYRIELISDKL